MVAIIDYGLGNLGSIHNMLKKIGAESVITSDNETILGADKLILPGVGAFDNGMNNLRERGLIEVLQQKVLVEKTPILGICLGMQLFTHKSEEGTLPGLGWIDAETVKFELTSHGRKYTVPHMGWEYVTPAKESRLLTEMYEEPKFYFVHSYYVQCAQESEVLLTTDYAIRYHSAFEKENIIGVQFHPEKSHKYGMKLLQNFIRLY